MTSTIKVNNIQNQCGANIINESSNTITIGASGDTVSLASGASQTGFGRTGTVDWETTVKTASFTATSGEGYFCNTTSSAFTVTLPASPSAGDIVAVKDYAATFATNNLTIGRNSQPIGGVADDLVLSTNQQSITLIYIDGTKGWLATNDSTTNAVPTKFVTATGGTITTCGDFKVHTFTGPGTFCVSCAGNPAGSTTVDYLVVAGGGGAGAGGGGGGGFRLSNSYSLPAPTTSPLANPSGITVSAQAYPITVGGGGTTGGQGAGSPTAPTPAKGGSGVNSVFSTITSAGGGGGGSVSPAPNRAGLTGGSGGGNGHDSLGDTKAAGNTPPVSPPQGQPGGTGAASGYAGAGGGGGAGAAGSCAPPSPSEYGGPGGNGSFVSPSLAGCKGTTGPVSSTRYFSGGGGGGPNPSSPSATFPQITGGAGGGGGSGPFSSPNNSQPGTAGTVNTGGGGGGHSHGCGPGSTGGAGGSGIVIIRYKFQ